MIDDITVVKPVIAGLDSFFKFCDVDKLGDKGRFLSVFLRHKDNVGFK